MDSDGLLSAGEPGSQLTWMDSKIGDAVITPRHGKPVEIQALWYNALRILEDFAASFGDEGARVVAGDLAALARGSFHEKFWNEREGCLFDVVNGGERDGSVRPNPI